MRRGMLNGVHEVVVSANANYFLHGHVAFSVLVSVRVCLAFTPFI